MGLAQLCKSTSRASLSIVSIKTEESTSFSDFLVASNSVLDISVSIAVSDSTLEFGEK